MTTPNVPPPPRLTGKADIDLAAVTAWAYSLHRVLVTDEDRALTSLQTSVTDLTATTAASFTATADVLTALATAIDGVAARLDAIAALVPVPGVYITDDLRDAINAIITSAAAPP